MPLPNTRAWRCLLISASIPKIDDVAVRSGDTGSILDRFHKVRSHLELAEGEEFEIVCGPGAIERRSRLLARHTGLHQSRRDDHHQFGVVLLITGGAEQRAKD